MYFLSISKFRSSVRRALRIASQAWIDNFPVYLRYKSINNGCYRDVNEHEEWSFDFMEHADFGVLKHF